MIDFCTSKRTTLKPMEASANLLMIYTVFDAMANLVGEPDLSDGVRVHKSETKFKNTSFHKLPISNLHTWSDLPEIFTALQKWQDFFDTEILRVTCIFSALGRIGSRSLG